jgi:PleD family two-component response regulator
MREGHALSIGRFAFAGNLPERSGTDAARLVTRLTRESDFACRDEDGSILIAFGQTDLRDAAVIARRIAAVLRNTMLTPDRSTVDANITLATLKAADTLDSLLMRVSGGEVVAAE